MFQNTLSQLCDRRHRGGHYTTRRPTYSSLHRYQASSLRRHQNNSISKENHSVHSEPVMILEHDNAIRLQSLNHNHHHHSLHRHHNTDNLSEFNQPLSRSETTTSSKEDLLFQLHSMPDHRRLTKCGTIVNTSSATLQRHNSETLSRATSITTMSKIPTYQSTTLMMEPSGTSTTDIVKVTKFGRPLSSIVVKKKSNRQLLKKRKSPISFVTLAHHLRSIFHTHSQQCEHGLNITPQHTISVTNGGDSGNNSANTISNSSLQDLDEAEFSSTDLVKYMGELNRTII